MNVGLAVRHERRVKNLSLRALAERAGVTASLLSQVETGRVNPSVDTLFALASALEIPVAHFFGSAESGADTPQPDPVRTDRRLTRRAERRRLNLETGITWELLTGDEQPGARFVEIHYPPGGRSANLMLRHGGRDFLVVVEGELTVQLEFQTYVLREGDSMWFDSSIPHQVRNESDAQARIISITIDPWPPAG